MSVERAVFHAGVRETRATLGRWNARPWPVLAEWTALSLAVALAFLAAVWAVAHAATPDPHGLELAGLTRAARPADALDVLFRNSLVLALHAMACVAGFIAGSSLPLSAQHRSGLDRWVHEKAGPLAIGFVVCATTFSLVTQALVIGAGTSTIADQLGISPGTLLVGLLPHALPELIALFLPLGAWLVASRRERWDELLAATVVTVAVAVPVLLASAAVELWVSPELLRALAS